MNLVIDSGNSAAKVGIFDHQNLIEKHTTHSTAELEQLVKKVAAEFVIISTVKNDSEEIAGLAKSAKKIFTLHPALPLPVKNRYATPSTLGADRIAGVCGAKQIFPFTNCLVIDAGTCITYDFLDKDAFYHGGGISPGLNMRFKSLHTFTAKLPFVSSKGQVPLIGNSTETSIQSGVVNGMLAEIEGIIEQYSKTFENLRVILCGGDALFFENQLKASIFASPELVLIGLNSILNHNVEP
jgi:type III pantothenate kinase